MKHGCDSIIEVNWRERRELNTLCDCCECNSDFLFGTNSTIPETNSTQQALVLNTALVFV